MTDHTTTLRDALPMQAEAPAPAPARTIDDWPQPAPCSLLTPEAKHLTDAFCRDGARWYFANPRLATANACPNCGPLGYIWIREVQAGPMAYIPQKSEDGSFTTWLGDGWYRVKDHRFPCPACGDPGARIRALFEQSGLLPNERDYRIDFIQGKEGKLLAHEQACAILQQIPRPVGWYALYGGFGVGKTGLMQALVAAACRAGVSAHYTLASDLLARIKATFRKDTPITEEEALELYGGYQVLAVDEIEKTADTAWSTAELMTVLDGRYRRRSTTCTLIASNRDPDDLPATLGYLRSRMQDGARVILGGDTLRGGTK